MTRSTAPQSIPRSRDDVATTALEGTPRHGGFDLAALFRGEAAVMQRNRQVPVVEAPEGLEHEFGLGARVDEDDRRAGFADRDHHLGHCVERHVAGPRHPLARREDRDRCLGTAAPAQEPHGRLRPIARGGQPIEQDRGLRHRGREADTAASGCQALEPRKAESQEIAALVARERMELVDDRSAQAGEDCSRVLV